MSVEDARETPRLVLEGLNVHDLDEQQVSLISPFDLEGPGQIMNPGEVDVPHVIGRVIILDLTTSPGRGLVDQVIFGREQRRLTSQYTRS